MPDIRLKETGEIWPLNKKLQEPLVIIASTYCKHALGVYGNTAIFIDIYFFSLIYQWC